MVKLRTYILFIILITSLHYCTASARTIEPYVRVTSERIKMRRGPDLTETVIADIPDGTVLQYLGKKNDWLNVKIPYHDKGYIAAGNTKFIHYKNIEILTTTLILDGPDVDYKVIGQANRGADLKVIGEESTYYLVIVKDSQLGWIDIRDTRESETMDIIQISSNMDALVAPYNDAPELSRIKRNTQLQKLDEKSGWSLVGDGGLVMGWIREDQVDELKFELSTNKSANLREGNSANYSIIGMLEPGTPLIVIDKKNDWYDVQTKEGLRGWIAASDVGSYDPNFKPTDDDTPTTGPPRDDDANVITSANPRYVITNQTAKIRQGYSTDFYVHQEVKEGTIVLLIGERDDWNRIRYYPKGRIGWMQKNYLRLGEIYFTNRECNIRQGYSTTFKVIRRVPPATPIAKLEREVGDWYRIYLPDGVVGWVRNDLITGEKDFYITNQFANVRGGPGTNSTKIATLKAGNVISIVERRGEWYRIKFAGDNEGWIMYELVSHVYDYYETNRDVALYSKSDGTGSLGTLRSGSGVFMIGEDRNSILVRNATRKGWIDPESVDQAYMNSLGDFLSEADMISGTTPPSSSPSPDPKPEPALPDVTTLYTYQETNIRLGPGLQYGQLIRLQPNESLEVIAKFDDWYNVKLPDGNTGYVRSDVVSKAPVQATTVKSQELFASQITQVYSEPDDNSDLTAMLQVGTKVLRKSVKGNWAYVITPSGKRGWVSNKLLQAESVEPINFEIRDITVDYGTLETTGEVNLRTGANILSEKIGIIKKGQRIKKIGFEKGWYAVETEQGRGYISADYAKDITIRPVITLKEIDVKESRSMGSRTIGEWYAGRVLKPFEQVGAWYAVPSNAGERGWIRKEDVTNLKFPELYAKGKVQVLREPTPDGTPNFSLAAGDAVRPLYDTINWYFIKSADGKNSGWVRKSAVSKQSLPPIRIRSNASAHIVPSMGAEVAGNLSRNEEYQPVARSGEWYKIQLRNNVYGWVYSSVYEEKTEGNIVVGDKVPIREGPGVEYQVSNYTNLGEVYKSIMSTRNWSQIKKPNGDIGWIEKKATKEAAFEPMAVNESIDIYAGPGEQFNIIKTVPASTKIVPIDENDQWYKIQISDNEYGWVKKQSERPAQTRTRVVFTLDTSRIMSEASESSKTVKEVDPATDLLVIGEVGDWFKVRLQRANIEGFVKKDKVFE